MSYLKPSDIDQIFDALDPTGRNSIEIFKIDEAIRHNATASGAEMHDELLEKIIRGYNNDDVYLFDELKKLD